MLSIQFMSSELINRYNETDVGARSRARASRYFSSLTLIPASLRICLILISIALMTFTSR